MASFDIGNARAALMRWELGLGGAYCAALAFLVVNGMISHQAIERSQESEREMIASLDARLAAETVLSTLKDAETGQRGYLLTRQDEFLEPYDLALSRYQEDLSKLRASVGRLKLENNNLFSLEKLARDRMQILTDNLNAIKGNPQGPVGIEGIRQGKQSMDRVRAEVETLKNQISIKIAELSRAAKIRATGAIRTNAVSTLAGIVFSTIAFFFATRLIRKRMELQEVRGRMAGDLERQVRARTADLKRANDEMEAFSYSVSHDLRAPLRSISGHAAILEEDYNEKLDDEGRQAIDRIKVSCRKMSDLIDDLLVLSRVTRGEMNVEAVDLSAMVREILDDVRQNSKRTNVEIEIESGVTAMGDKRLTRVLLENLLRNAWKFTGKNEITQIHFGRVRDRGEKLYFVQDNGVGFEPEYASKIFLPFQRLHRDQDFEGSGIGLAIVHRIVERHGGRAWGEGELDKGATFYFSLEPEDLPNPSDR